MMLKLFLLVAFSALVFTLSVENHSCGYVFDGSSVGSDLSTQTSNSSIFANWEGFDSDKRPVLRYEWAVISEAQASKIKGDNCRLIPGFYGNPDVLGWKNAGKQTSGSAQVSLKTGETYFIILRVTTTMGKVYANSNGVTIVEEEKPFVRSSTKHTRSADLIPNDVKFPGQPLIFPNGAIFVGYNNPIDRDNRLNAAKVSVADRLNAIYGLPQFAQDERANTIFTTVPASNEGVGYGVNFNPFPTPFPKRLINDEDDDDDHLNDGAIIGISLGIAAFFCIMVFCVIVIAFIVAGLRKANRDDDGDHRGGGRSRSSKGRDGEF